MATRKNTTAAATGAPGPAARPCSATCSPSRAMLDLLRIAVERDFAAGRFECRQESAAVACGHALHLGGTAPG